MSDEPHPAVTGKMVTTKAETTILLRTQSVYCGDATSRALPHRRCMADDSERLSGWDSSLSSQSVPTRWSCSAHCERAVFSCMSPAVPTPPPYAPNRVASIRQYGLDAAEVAFIEEKVTPVE